MGALAAYEAARLLHADPTRPRPVHLFLSGRRSPRTPNRLPLLHGLPDEAFLDGIAERYGGIPDQVRAEPDLIRLLLPCLRADVTAVETHRWEDAAPLEVPVTVLCGLDDPTTRPEEAEAWRAETRGPFAFFLFPGQHFFLNSSQDRVLEVIGRTLETALGGES